MSVACRGGLVDIGLPVFHPPHDVFVAHRDEILLQTRARSAHGGCANGLPFGRPPGVPDSDLKKLETTKNYFEFSRPERPAFDVLFMCEPLAPLVTLDFPFDFSLFSLLFPLPSLLDHDLLCLPLPDDCLPVLLRALQSR